MVATCTQLEAEATEGNELCGLMEGVGTGTGAALNALKSPLGIFVIFLGVAAGVVGLYAAINSRVKASASK